MRAQDNPFASRNMDSLPYIPVTTDWSRIRDRLRCLNGRGAIVGPKGTGKTTLMEAMERRLTLEGYNVSLFRLSQDRNLLPREETREVFSGLTGQSALLLDGAEQMSWLAWKACAFRARKTGILVVTSHAPGLLPTLVETTTSPQLLQALANRMLPRDSFLDLTQAQALFQTHHGNLRLAFMELYDVWARR